MTTAVNNPSGPSMTGKTVLVTGATNGVGEKTAEALAAMGARVFVHGRNPEKGARTVAAIKESTGNHQVEFVESDFSDLDSVRDMAEQVKAKTNSLDVLVNNAGGMYKDRLLTKDGFEMTFGTNHLAHFLLTHLLLDLLKASAPARIITVSSIVHWVGKIDFNDLQCEVRSTELHAYNQAKLANVLFTQELARRLEGTGVTANALHPGAVRSGFGQNNESGIGKKIIQWVRPFLITPQKGAETSVYLASSPDVASVTGSYFSNSKPARMAKKAKDQATALRLWDVSLAMTGLSPST